MLLNALHGGFSSSLVEENEGVDVVYGGCTERADLGFWRVEGLGMVSDGWLR